MAINGDLAGKIERKVGKEWNLQKIYTLCKELELYANNMESGVNSFTFRTFKDEKVSLGKRCLQESRGKAMKFDCDEGSKSEEIIINN